MFRPSLWEGAFDRLFESGIRSQFALRQNLYGACVPTSPLVKSIVYKNRICSRVWLESFGIHPKC